MIALKSENQLFKKVLKEFRNTKVNMSKPIEESTKHDESRIKSIFEHLNGNTHNYYYSYGKKTDKYSQLLEFKSILIHVIKRLLIGR